MADLENFFAAENCVVLRSWGRRIREVFPLAVHVCVCVCACMIHESWQFFPSLLTFPEEQEERNRASSNEATRTASLTESRIFFASSCPTLKLTWRRAAKQLAETVCSTCYSAWQSEKQREKNSISFSFTASGSKREIPVAVARAEAALNHVTNLEGPGLLPFSSHQSPPLPCSPAWKMVLHR